MERNSELDIELRLNKKTRELLEQYLPNHSDEQKVLSIIQDFFKFGLDQQNNVSVILDREFGGNSGEYQQHCPICHCLLTFRYRIKNDEVAQKWRAKLFNLFGGNIFVGHEMEYRPREKSVTLLVGDMSDTSCPNCRSPIFATNGYSGSYRPATKIALEEFIVEQVSTWVWNAIKNKIPEDKLMFNKTMTRDECLSMTKGANESKIEQKSWEVGLGIPPRDVYTSTEADVLARRFLGKLGPIEFEWIDSLSGYYDQIAIAVHEAYHGKGSR